MKHFYPLETFNHLTDTMLVTAFLTEEDKLGSPHLATDQSVGVGVAIAWILLANSKTILKLNIDTQNADN